VILLGLGFTGSRLARRLLVRGMDVYGVSRDPSRFRALEAVGLQLNSFDAASLPKGDIVVHSIPPEAAGIREFIEAIEPKRVIYVSSNGVYGDRIEVDHTTEPRDCVRFREEQWIASGPWRTLIVRPVAIYGPGRGVQEKIRRGKLPRGAGGFVSRIHVDDLAAVLEAGVLSDLEGAWPLADDRPCPSEEIAEFCARLLRVPMPRPEAAISISGRKVDGREVRTRLGVELLYPEFESGIIASVAEIATISNGVF
jgi:nucleoside-diphosphate-sugar epimerase